MAALFICQTVKENNCHILFTSRPNISQNFHSCLLLSLSSHVKYTFLSFELLSHHLCKRWLKSYSKCLNISRFQSPVCPRARIYTSFKVSKQRWVRFEVNEIFEMKIKFCFVFSLIFYPIVDFSSTQEDEGF